tara:strand:- start:728 stop:1474 length:747 start_codon:yes stop_codon:yes gene_type:complete
MSLAILIPLCSRNQKWKTIEDIDFFDVFLDGFLHNYSNKQKFKFYLGLDENDEFLMNELDNMKKRCDADLFEFFILPKTCNGNPCLAWSMLYEEALKEPTNEYFYQCGSDIVHLTPNFDSFLIGQLMLMGGNGIVGGVELRYWQDRLLCNQNGIIENAMVTRKHYELFGWFFPPEVKTWFSDDMLTRIYLNADLCRICSNIQFRNSNRVLVSTKPETHRYKIPKDTSEIAKNWINIADKYSVKIFEKK